VAHCLAIAARLCAPAARGPAPLVLWLAIVAWCPVNVACSPVTVAHCPSPEPRLLAREARRPALLARCPSEVIGLSALLAESEGPTDLAPMDTLFPSYAVAVQQLAFPMLQCNLGDRVGTRLSALLIATSYLLYHVYLAPLCAEAEQKAIGLFALLAKLKGSPDPAPLNSLPTSRAVAEPKLAYLMQRSYLRCKVAIGLFALLAKLKGSPDLAPLNSLPAARAMAEPRLAHPMQRSYLRCKVPVRSYLRNLH